jgi:hypothetical protein
MVTIDHTKSTFANSVKEDSMTKQYCISLFTYTIEDMVSAGNVPELYTLA